MRVVKEAEERRNEILDVSEKLFLQKGFDSTSIADILNEVTIARGTLYYHFKSKEEILDGIIHRLTSGLVEKAGAIVEQKEVPVLQRLTRMMQALSIEDDLKHEILEQAHKPHNALMHRKMQDELSAGILPLITMLIEEGIARGICRTAYPAEVAEMTFLYCSTAFDGLAEVAGDARDRKTAAFIYNLERLLGMEEGSMQEAVLPIFKTNQS